MWACNRWVPALLLLSLSSTARGEFHTLQIEQIFSNADGTVQFVVLHETLGLNGEGFLGGHTLTAMSGAGTHTFVFPTNLPGGTCDVYGCGSSPTANARVLVATQGFAALGLVTPDYVMPNGFLPLSNGTINYAGVDQVSYMSIPSDGVTAVTRNGSARQNVATNFNGQSASVPAAPPPVTATAVEYYYGAWNFYFETAFPQEIAALDGGAFGGVWQRTGQVFTVWTGSGASPLAMPTCRFFSTAFGEKSAHFYTPFPNECSKLQTDPALSAAWQLETATAFYVALTDANGNCPPGTTPLYRVFNNSMGGAPNHRYTTDASLRASMVSQGWSAEGNGPDTIFACLPQ
jgi:hypothetical protein